MTSPAARLRLLAPASALLLAGTVLTGCGALSSAESPASGREVVAAFYPLAWVADRVAGEHLEVTNLTAPGQEPHDLELAARDIASLSDARVVIHETGLQPAVDAAVAEHARGEVVDVVDVVELRPFADHSNEAHAEAGHADETEGHEEEGHKEESHEGDGHEEESGHDHEGEADPHFWHDPLLMADYADALATRFAELDPDQADAFAANAAALRTELEALDEEFTTGLASCERDLVVVNHDAFGYLARYGLHLEPIVGLSPDAEADAGTLARLRQLIRDEGVTTVFAERLVSRKTSESLARGAGVETAVLDPIEGLTSETEDEDYLSLMRHNLEGIREANGC